MPRTTVLNSLYEGKRSHTPFRRIRKALPAQIGTGIQTRKWNSLLNRECIDCIASADNPC